MRAVSPLVEKLGLVLPRRNGPHSGCPYSAHPASLVDSSKMSRQPIGSSGHPRASAIGSGMAMTSGVSMNGVPSPAMGSSPCWASRWSTMAPQPLKAGDQMTGRGPSASSSHPSTSNAAPRPEDFDCGSTTTHCPSTSARSDWLKVPARSVNSSIFSGETAMSMTAQSPESPAWSPAPFAESEASSPLQAVAKMSKAIGTTSRRMTAPFRSFR